MGRAALIRGLTPGEADLCREVFGDALDPARVRMIAAPWPVFRAFAAGRWFGRDWIVWPRAFHRPDFAAEPVRRQGVLIHELTHLWQARQGVGLLVGKLRAGWSNAAYVYAPGPDSLWSELNIEQQAMVVEHRFLLSRGVTTPADQAFYDRICPLARRVEI